MQGAHVILLHNSLGARNVSGVRIEQEAGSCCTSEGNRAAAIERAERKTTKRSTAGTCVQRGPAGRTLHVRDQSQYLIRPSQEQVATWTGRQNGKQAGRGER